MRRPSRRTVVWGVAFVLVVAVIGNMAGFLRYPGGPLVAQNADWPFWLDHRASDQGNNKVGYSPSANVATGVPTYIGLDARNRWPWAATLERVRLVNGTPGLRLLDARLVRPGATPLGAVGIVSGSGELAEELGLLTMYESLPRTVSGNNGIQDGRMWIEVVADQPGEQSFDSVLLDYRVGPFSFTVDLYQAFAACIDPMPVGTVCSWDEK
jgi:hypothetical protein